MSADETPFRSLRQPVVPLAPRPDFRRDLRLRLEAALIPEPTTTPTAQTATAPPQEEAMTTTEATTDATTTGSPLAPYLAVTGAAEAIAWYVDVLGAIETTRLVGDDGRVGHAELVIGGARLMLADEFPEMGVHGPGHYGGTSVMLHLTVVDIDHTFARAVESGAEAQREPADQGHGNRNATIVDPWGHRWMLSQPIDADRTASAEQERGTGGDGASWEVTGRKPVEPGYLTMRTGDLARAREFFGALFAWDVVAGSVEGGGHIHNTRFPMGFMQTTDLPDADAPDATRLYFRVDDIEPYAQRVTELGGQVLARAEHASGGNAECVDDQGFRFDLFQPAPGY